jgi:hypothetical protein
MSWLKLVALKNARLFSKAIKDGTFSIDDINIVNGTIDSGSFTKVSEMQYTIMVTPSLGVKHSN